MYKICEDFKCEITNSITKQRNKIL